MFLDEKWSILSQKKSLHKRNVSSPILEDFLIDRCFVVRLYLILSNRVLYKYVKY